MLTLKNEFKTLQEVTTQPKFLTEWNNQQYKKVNQALRRLFIGRTLTNHRSEKRTMHTLIAIENFFGLPYTSSSSYAMISNTNTIYYIDEDNQYNIEYFAMDEQENVYLVAWDREEKEVYFLIQ